MGIECSFQQYCLHFQLVQLGKYTMFVQKYSLKNAPTCHPKRSSDRQGEELVRVHCCESKRTWIKTGKAKRKEEDVDDSVSVWTRSNAQFPAARHTPSFSRSERHEWNFARKAQRMAAMFGAYATAWLINYLVGALSPVSHKGLHQGWTHTSIYLQVCSRGKGWWILSTTLVIRHAAFHWWRESLTDALKWSKWHSFERGVGVQIIVPSDQRTTTWW